MYLVHDMYVCYKQRTQHRGVSNACIQKIHIHEFNTVLKSLATASSHNCCRSSPPSACSSVSAFASAAWS